MNFFITPIASFTRPSQTDMLRRSITRDPSDNFIECKRPPQLLTSVEITLLGGFSRMWQLLEIRQLQRYRIPGV